MDEKYYAFPWLTEATHHLTRYIELNRFPQALMVIARSDFGQRTLIENYINALLCTQITARGSACGQCSNCKLILAGSHPDVKWVTPEQGKQIGIDKIRELTTQLMLKPQFAGWRVAVIEQAEMLTQASANAFLKFLEEPTERTMLILIASSSNSLPATIRSRCQLLSVAQPSREVALAWLATQAIHSPQSYLDMANGSPIQALHYAELNLLEIYQSCYQDWIAAGLGKANIVAVAEKWDKQEQPGFSMLIIWMMQWLNGLIRELYKVDHIFDGQDNLQELVKKLDLNKVFQFYDGLLWARKQESGQLNKQVLIEKLLITWSS